MGSGECIDYIDINKACPKDPFPLPRIDQIVDSTAGCDLLSFLDAYSGSHQIFMTKEDEEKTTFITPCGASFEKHANEMQMMTWKNATRKQMTWQQ